MTRRGRIRVYVAGAWGAMVTQAVVVAASRNVDVELIGISLDRVDASVLSRERPDLLVSAAHRWILPPEITSIPRIGAVGVHPSLLPKYRGSWPLWWALVNGEPEVGVTAFVLTDSIDAGPILRQQGQAVRPGEPFNRLYERVAPLAGAISTSWSLKSCRQANSRPASRRTKGLPPTSENRQLGSASSATRSGSHCETAGV